MTPPTNKTIDNNFGILKFKSIIKFRQGNEILSNDFAAKGMKFFSFSFFLSFFLWFFFFCFLLVFFFVFVDRLFYNEFEAAIKLDTSSAVNSGICKSINE